MYKVGDRVIVKRDLEDGMCYDGVAYVKSMDKFKSSVQIINGIESYGIYNAYYLVGDEEEYIFTDSMLELAPTEPKPMTNLEKFKDEIIELIHEGESTNCSMAYVRTGKICKGANSCAECVIASLEWLAERHKPTPTLNQFERDLLSTLPLTQVFNLDYQCLKMAEKGYFKGLDDECKLMQVGEILEMTQTEEIRF